jgi:hypothetical protein
MKEEELYLKAMGIEQARKDTMPTIAKIPKRLRRSSSGGRCERCRQETLEGHEDGHGMWHYRCQYCVDHQKSDPNPCPRCHCTSHTSIPTQECDNPFAPSIAVFRCLNCTYEWFSDEYQRFLLGKAVKSVLPKSQFSKDRNI